MLAKKTFTLKKNKNKKKKNDRTGPGWWLIVNDHEIFTKDVFALILLL